MMISIALLLGVTAGNPYSALKMEEAWKEELTFDWDELDHVAAFKHWASTFDKVYVDLEEESHRFLIFLDNWKMINDHNEAMDTSYRLKINQFADLTRDEFRYHVHGHSGSCLKRRTVRERVAMHEVEPQILTIPDSVDWTNVNGKSFVTPIKNQGQCGSCWAFSTTGSIESRTAIKTGKLVSLSEQQLVDCSKSYGNDGCNGGLMDDAFKYVEAAGGLCTEEEYPYTGQDGKECLSSRCGTKYDDISSYDDVTHDSSSSLEAAVAAGPVSIAIEADQSAFQFYSSGVLDGRCGDRLDHGVLVVGYGSDGNQDYWKVKNSWGQTWGDNGYVMLCRNCDKNDGKGECGILETPSYPVSS